MASRLPPGEPLTDSSARRAALEVIRENWLMHLALIPLFAYRGVYLMLPLLAAVTFVALRKQDLGLLSFLAPMLYAIAIYASVSHYLPRYSVHGIPCALLSVAWLAKLASQRIRLSHA